MGDFLDSVFICPYCNELLKEDGKSYSCVRGHSFDIAKSGYVNLLPPSGHGRHGDDKMMVQARTEFLNQGFYEPLRREIVSIVNAYLREQSFVVDAGCGEGYYTGEISKMNPSCTIVGIDLSKDALISSGKKYPSLHLAVASTAKMPIACGRADMLLNLFSPLFLSEFSRILCDGGYFIRVFPLRYHLYELKAAIYDHPYENDEEPLELPGFQVMKNKELTYTIELNHQETIEQLFMMTPYYYKTGAQDQEKLKNLQNLKTTVSFGIVLYQKNEEESAIEY